MFILSKRTTFHEDFYTVTVTSTASPKPTNMKSTFLIRLVVHQGGVEVKDSSSVGGIFDGTPAMPDSCAVDIQKTMCMQGCKFYPRNIS